MQEENEIVEDASAPSSLFERLEVSLIEHGDSMVNDLDSVWVTFDVPWLQRITNIHTMLTQSDEVPSHFCLSYSCDKGDKLRNESGEVSDIRVSTFDLNICNDRVFFTGTEKHTEYQWISEPVRMATILKCLHPEN